jgi:glycosyltransferase involved in cell wall biosynthesis
MRISILVSTRFQSGLSEKIREDLYPQQDFLALAEALDARLITPLNVPPGIAGKASRAFKIFRSAWAAFRQRSTYDLIISDADRPGMILALLFKLTGTRKRLVLICHGKITHAGDLALLRSLNLQQYIHCFVCYGPAVAESIRESLGLPHSRVVTVRHAADHHFWRPLPVPEDNLVVSAGMLNRDYPTLVEAVRGQDVSLIIAAHSPWVSGKETGINPQDLPPNVHITRCDYSQLRDLYARARCVAIPLASSVSQSGSLVTYEAMAMGKPVLVTRTQGQDSMAIVQEGETGFYLPPGDTAAWRSRIKQLCANPQAARAMGETARRVVEDGMNLEAYVDQMTRIVQAVSSPGQPPGRPRNTAGATTTSVEI